MANSRDEVIVRIKGEETVSSTTPKALNALDRLQKKAASMAAKFKTIGKSMSLYVTAPILALGGLATKAAIDFESAFTGVRKTVEATESQFAALKKGFMAMAREIPISTEELFRVGEAAGQLGIKQENILSFTKVMADLGATTNLTAEEAALALAQFGNITGLAAKDYERLGSTIVDLGNNSATMERRIVDMGMRLAGAGNFIGMTGQQIMSLAAALSSVGIRAEAGGTAFSRVMKEIDKESGIGSDAMKRFAEISGMSVADFETQWKENAAGALVSFTEGLGKIQKAGGNVNIVLDELGLDSIRIADSLLRAAGSGDLFRKALELGSKAWEENTALAKEANLRYGTTASQLTIAKNKATQMAATFGEILAPALLKVVDFLEPMVEWLKDLSPAAKTLALIIAGLVAAIGPLLISLGMLSAAIAAISAPVTIVVAAIVGLAALAWVVISNWEVITQFYADLWADVVKTFDAVLATITGKVSEWYEVGRSLVMGMVDGVMSAVSWLVDAAVSAAISAISAVKSVLGISSPSAVFADFGRQMMAGMAAGIMSGAALPQYALAAAIPGAGGSGGTVPASQNQTDNRQDNRQYQDVVMYNSFYGDNGYDQGRALREALKVDGGR